MPASAVEVRRFAYRQGPGRTLLNQPVEVDDAAPTTAMLAPRTARGTIGHPLPMDTRVRLEAAPYPGWPINQPGVLGHLLVTAFGLQHREPSNAFNDHRVVASVRSKFPVHIFVIPALGKPSYLDLYRHALVEVEAAVVPDELRPPAGRTAVLLAARYTDLPTGYAWLRGALTEVETGVNLRALFDSADLHGVPVRLRGDAGGAVAGAVLQGSTGDGAWGPPTLVLLDTATIDVAVALPVAGPPRAAVDVLLHEQATHWSVGAVTRITDQAYAMDDDVTEPAHGLPPAGGADAVSSPGDRGPSWARVIRARSAGRAPKGVSGFTVIAAPVGVDCVADMIAFAAVPPPSPRLRAVAGRVYVRVALQGAGDYPTGIYRLTGRDLEPTRTDSGVMAGIQRQFGYPLTPRGACGIRHATAVWVLSTDVGALIDELGPTAWTLLQRYCGWVSHGICTACAAHGLFARPARSFDEHAMQSVLDLPAGEMPLLITVCGRAQFSETLLDLRP